VILQGEIADRKTGGSLERLCQTIPATGKPFWTLDDPANAHLTMLGAAPIGPEQQCHPELFATKDTA
jgi:hypothetical protein